MKKTILLWVLIASAWIFLTVKVKTMPAFNPGDFLPKNGMPPPDFTLPDLHGGTASLSDFRGKVVLLNFWATWCGPCKREIPDIRKFLKEHREEGLVVVAVNVGEPRAAVQVFTEKNDMPFTVLLDEREEVARRYGITGYPTNFILDREGKVRYKRSGMMDPYDWWESTIFAGLGIGEERVASWIEDNQLLDASRPLLERLKCPCGSGATVADCSCGPRGAALVYADFKRMRLDWNQHRALSYTDEQIFQMLKWKYQMEEVSDGTAPRH